MRWTHEAANKRQVCAMNSPTVQIPSSTWQPYFEDLAEQYQGWATTIEVLAGKLGDQRAADGLPLQGLSYEAKGGSQAGDVLVEVGDVGTPFQTHLIHHPRAVRMAVSQPGSEADIEIESNDGVTTIVRLRRRPELPPPGLA
jgi:hypothetical protein